MADSDLPLEPSDLHAMWDFGDPSASAARFAAMLDRIDPGSIQANELTTQQARAYGLMGSFAEGHRLLDGLAGSDLHPVVIARIALERGRLLNSAGDPGAAVPWFVTAVEASRDDLAVDALHMLAIADGDREPHWYAQGVAAASASSVPAVRRWLGPLHNNHGWALHESGRPDEALTTFQAALAAWNETGNDESIRIAEWTVARCLRSLGRRDEALAIQQRLKAEGPPDPYVDEELALLTA